MYEEPLSMEEYIKLLELGGQNSELAAQIKQQLAMAEQLRAEAPSMRGNSRIQVAPHFMEYLGGLARNRASALQSQAATDSQKRAAQNTNLQNQMIMQGILRQPRARQQMPGMYADPYERFRRDNYES